MAKNLTREEKVLNYLNEWHDGLWALNVHSKDGQDVRIAENVISYHGLKESRTTLDAYVSTVRALTKSGKLDWRLGAFSGTWVVVVRD